MTDGALGDQGSSRFGNPESKTPDPESETPDPESETPDPESETRDRLESGSSRIGIVSNRDRLESGTSRIGNVSNRERLESGTSRIGIVSNRDRLESGSSRIENVSNREKPAPDTSSTGLVPDAQIQKSEQKTETTDQKPQTENEIQKAQSKTSRHGVPNLGRPYNMGVFGRYPELRRVFLQHLAQYGNKTAAAAHVRLSLEQIGVWERKHVEFKAEVEEARDRHCAKIEKAIHDRAIDGWEEPKFSARGLVGTVRRYSDNLLLAYAKRHIAEYREGSHQSASVKVAHEHTHKVDLGQLSDPQRKALRLLLENPEPEPRLIVEPASIHPESPQ